MPRAANKKEIEELLSHIRKNRVYVNGMLATVISIFNSLRLIEVWSP
jgi:hypothetical protein